MVHFIKSLTVMNKFVRLQTIRLSKPRSTNITFVWFLSCVNTQMSLQFERIRAGICTVWALKILIEVKEEKMQVNFALT